MLESLRGLGYSTATALADLIDNSVAARASCVQVCFVWREADSCIYVIDNGEGMNERQLDLAMRLGELSPLAHRKPTDLGRFGMGLKTASFSQCRRLTVASVRQDSTGPQERISPQEPSCLHWDLDVLDRNSDGRWHLMEGPGSGSEEAIKSLQGMASGTVVHWGVMDRIVTPGFTDQDFLDLIDRVEDHLAMVFHRYLAGPNPRLKILINGRAVAPWDPFLLVNTATWRSPAERIVTDTGAIDIQCFVLPHRDRLDARLYESAGGPEGWTAQQGFYVYRNQRLLVAGSWLGLGSGRPWTKEEGHRLARIRLDLPNTADVAWKIDIRKSTARPPVSLRERLARLAEDTRARARRVFAHRGQVAVSGGNTQVTSAWKTVRSGDSLQYRIDEDHPAIQMALQEAGPLQATVKAMLRVIEETVPVQRIWLDAAESKEVARNNFSTSQPDEIATVMGAVYRNLLLYKDLSPARARERLLATEPFNQYPDLVEALPDDPGLLERHLPSDI